MAYTTINKSSLHFNTKLYTGTASSNALTGINFSPSWVWIKRRDGTYNHNLYDAVRGVTKEINSNNANAESTVAQGLTAFGTDGFTLGSDDQSNASGDTFVAWNWKAGTTGSGTTGGSGTAKSYSYSVNTTSGFSIVKYEGNGTNNHQIPHHLGAVPKMIIFKNEQDGYGWDVYHVSMGNAKRMYLSATNAETSATNFLYSTTPTSTYINLGDAGHTNHSGTSHIAYVFAEKTGFSKFGSYTGNGSTDGSYIHLGFKPAWIMVKRTDTAKPWMMYDNKRIGYNPDNNQLQANDSVAEATNDFLDIVSNGFKVRTTDSTMNTSSGSYIYMAFAEAPLVGSNNVPCTAR
tara:strand:+ start:665 stop:1705 length:1041 start_codon:yes stop_codon:yes gene_type:complete